MSSLLFSALVTRIFGVKREKNEFSPKNSMTFRAFFRRFPGLYHFFLNELTSVSKVLENKNIQDVPFGEESGLYTVLIILAKLSPSPISDGQDEFKA